MPLSEVVQPHGFLPCEIKVPLRLGVFLVLFCFGFFFKYVDVTTPAVYGNSTDLDLQRSQ